MKYTNMISNLGTIAWKALHVFLIIISLALFGTMVFFSIWLQTLIFSVIMMPMMIVFLGLVLNFELEIIAGSKLYDTGIVHDGDSLIDVEKGPNYYKRKKFIDFIQCGWYLAYIIYFIFNLGNETGWAIGGIVIFLSCAALYFIIGMSSIEKDKAINNR